MSENLKTIECETCNGDGVVDHYTEDEDCPSCDGVGSIVVVVRP